MGILDLCCIILIIWSRDLVWTLSDLPTEEYQRNALMAYSLDIPKDFKKRLNYCLKTATEFTSIGLRHQNERVFI